jgi:hypothetical protein
MFKPVKILALAIVLSCAGCGNLEPGNKAETPWNRPTKSDISQNWLFRDQYLNQDGGRETYP